MKKHMTQLELTKTRRLIESGITDVPEIQKHVFCHESRILHVLKGYDIEIPEPPAPPVRKAVKKKTPVKKTAQKSAAAERVARKEAQKAVDPIS